MKTSLFLGLCLAASGFGYVGQWHSYTDKSRVHALIEHKGLVYAGTNGGIRRIDPSLPATAAETEFDNLDGLVDVWITGFVKDTTGALWAVARDGYLYTLRGNRWEASGRSFASQFWIMNDRAVISAGSYLYLGSQKGLAVFDVSKKISQQNIVRFQNETEVSVLSVLRREDTLFVGTTRGVFKATVDFAKPLTPGAGYSNLADPTAWTLVRPDTGYQLNIEAGALTVRGPGSLLQAPVRVEAFTGSPLVIGSHTYMDWNDYEAALNYAGKVYAGGNSGLAVSANPSGATSDAAVRAPLRLYPRDSIINIGANAGTVWGHSYSGLQKFNAATGNFVYTPSLVIAPSAELTQRALRNVAVAPNGDAYVGTWGYGLVREGVNDRVWKHTTDSCIYTFDANDPWSIANAVSKVRGNDFFFSVFKPQSADNQLVHLDVSMGTVSCPAEGLAVQGSGPRSVYQFSDTLVGVTSERGLALLKVRKDLDGIRFESKGVWLAAGRTSESWDITIDGLGRPWVLIGSTLASLNLDSLDLNPAHTLNAIDNFAGVECRSLESDAGGGLWVGCANGLYSVKTTEEGGLTNVKRYGQDDGLLSREIYDLSVDPTTGYVWIATVRGVNMLESATQPAPPSGSVGGVLPYPNPFRPQHRFVIFDNLPRNATLRLHNSTGTVVRIFHPRDLTGDQAQWDGTNEQGKPVAAGVYVFSIVSGSAVQRGKIIVAR